MGQRIGTFAGTIPVIRVSRAEREAQSSRVGLWAQSSGSFFENPRALRTVDPTPHEAEMIAEGRIVGYVSPERRELTIN